MKELSKLRKIYIGLFAIVLIVMGTIFVMHQSWGRSSADEYDSANEYNIQGLEIVFPQVSEDSDAIILRTSKACVIIDTGLEEDASNLVDCLSDLKAKDIDALIITHPDKDHIGGAADVLAHVNVKQVYQTGFVKGSEEQALLEVLKSKEAECESITVSDDMTLTYDGLELTLLAPKAISDREANDTSIIVIGNYAGKDFVFAGDAMKERIAELDMALLPTDVYLYKLPYHGRKVKGAKELYQLLNPENVVVTGAEPSKKTMQYIENSPAKLYSSLEGEVRFFIADK